VSFLSSKAPLLIKIGKPFGRSFITHGNLRFSRGWPTNFGTSFGSERGSHLIRRCSLGWAYDAGRRCAGFDSPPLLSFISRLLLRFCFVRYHGMSELGFGKESCLGSWRFSCFWVWFGGLFWTASD
jgi:hypothetical protein